MTNVLDLAIEHGLSPVKVGGTHGGEFASPCPFCGGRDRFRIWPEQNEGAGSYWCRQCGAHGDRIQFVMDTRKIAFPEAARITGDEEKLKPGSGSVPGPRCSYETPRPPAVPRPRPEYEKGRPNLSSVAQPPSDQAMWQEKAGRLIEWASGKVSGTIGQSFLESKGLGGGAWSKYEIGYIPEDVYRPRASWGLPDVLKEDGKPKRLWIPGGVVIPLRNRLSGAVERLRVRRMEGDPKYYVVPGSTAAQMTLGNPRISVIVVESEIDAILIDHVAGDITGVVALGSSHVKPDKATDGILSSSACILVALDFDKAGTSAAKWWLSAYGRRAKRWPVPDGKDPSDAWAGGVSLREWIIAGWPSGWRQITSGSARGVAPPAPHPECHDESSAAPVASDAACEDDLKGPINSLWALLKKNPRIEIVVTTERLSLVAPDAWKARNPDIFQKISRAIFFDPEVFDYLHGHGAERINCHNLFVEGA